MLILNNTQNQNINMTLKIYCLFNNDYKLDCIKMS